MAMMEHDTLPFQIQIWVKAPGELTFFGPSSWLEMARCATVDRAKEVAECLHIRYELVRVSELQDDRFMPFLWLPDEATVKSETERT